MYEIFYIVYNVKATRDILKISQDPNMQKYTQTKRGTYSVWSSNSLKFEAINLTRNALIYLTFRVILTNS